MRTGAGERRGAGGMGAGEVHWSDRYWRGGRGTGEIEPASAAFVRQTTAVGTFTCVTHYRRYMLTGPIYPDNAL